MPKKFKTDKNRLDTMVEFLTESHLDVFGGYPHDYRWIGQTLVVADLDDGKERNATQLLVTNRSALIAWCKRAEKYQTKFPNSDIEECLYETERKERR
jgi:hypothetical protein